MRTKTIWITVIGLAVLLAAVGIASAIPLAQQQSAQMAITSSTLFVPEGTAAEKISYQGRLTSPGGGTMNGTFVMRFVVYDAAVGGTAVYDSGNMNVTINGGLFNIQLDVDQSDFNGQALWLSIIVEGETLSPRQELIPAPYALSLRPGADIIGEPLNANDAVVEVELSGVWPDGRAGGFLAPATGTAVEANAGGGTGIYGSSGNNYGIWGSSQNSWGGYFTSEQGYGIRVHTSGTDHYDHGAYITSQGGYGVYAQSATNQGVRGEAGDVTDIAQPLGTVGVVGIGQNRGTYGASGSGVGVYGNSSSNYAGYFYSNGYRALYASSDLGYYAGYFTNRGGSSQPGIYVNGTLTVTGSKSGYVVDICLNEGPVPLEVGDVVAVVGISDPVVGEIPVMRVVKATAENASAVVGVVDQRFVVDEENGESVVLPDTAVPQLDAGNAIQPGEYVSVVTLGAFKLIKIDADFGAIQPGDLLTPSPNAGYAMRAGEAAPGTIIGKALDGLETGQGVIAVYVTMQ